MMGFLQDMSERVKDELHELESIEENGGYINDFRDRHSDMELLIAYRQGINVGKRLARKKKK